MKNLDDALQNQEEATDKLLKTLKIRKERGLTPKTAVLKRDQMERTRSRLIQLHKEMEESAEELDAETPTEEEKEKER